MEVAPKNYSYTGALPLYPFFSATTAGWWSTRVVKVFINQALKKNKVIPLFREGDYKYKRAMAVNRGFVQLIPLTVYCWLERFASCEEDLSMPGKCLSALPYIYSCRVQGMSLCPHAFFVFLSYASKPLWGLCVFFPPLANFVIAW